MSQVRGANPSPPSHLAPARYRPLVSKTEATGDESVDGADESDGDEEYSCDGHTAVQSNHASTVGDVRR